MSWLEDYLASINQQRATLAGQAQGQAAQSGGTAAPSATNPIDPAFAAAIGRRDPMALAFEKAGAPEISGDFAAQVAGGGADTLGFLRAGGGLKTNPAVAQLLAGYQKYLAAQRARQGGVAAGALGAGNQDPLLAAGGQQVGEAQGGLVGEGGLPAGVFVNTQAGNARQGHAGMSIEQGGKRFNVYYDERGRRVQIPA